MLTVKSDTMWLITPMYKPLLTVKSETMWLMTPVYNFFSFVYSFFCFSSWCHPCPPKCLMVCSLTHSVARAFSRWVGSSREVAMAMVSIFSPMTRIGSPYFFYKNKQFQVFFWTHSKRQDFIDSCRIEDIFNEVCAECKENCGQPCRWLHNETIAYSHAIS